MKSINASLIAGAVAISIAGPAAAADMPLPVYKAPVAIQTGGWYLRGDIGMTNQKVKELTSPDPAFAGVSVVQKEFDSSMLFGLGIGYQFNNWFRVDATGEYRGGSTFTGLDVWNNGTGLNRYEGIKSEWLFLANAYIDLGTWWCFTPFVGAGIGVSRNTISNFVDFNMIPPNNALGYSNSHSQWEMAWALHAGIAYKINNNFTAEFAYRYVNLGDAATNDLIGYNGANAVYNPILFNTITSHDFKLALRWNLSPTETIAPIAMPAYAPPAAYNPPPAPVYAPPPPLMRKG
ncbi:outer membrane protein [Pseudorhodoplanes sp.]|uniref:outer membrane protein n=1 Tax=Pseudorhodoplanes sp. TaxID=1934341 RepID=UPI002C222D64|nr:outer membrane beta-barrel protein [Pseudorhodoplanes sp.]HWV52282.1 outer membrane beta-barrel protein [Pseudorhodoplanes sp.]